ncbi:MAG: DUF2357 domain-containing protein [Lachnospiraceae bacterium]|nr:DUF2357 domain-containing protein [Lachnospiraceae bacterium]
MNLILYSRGKTSYNKEANLALFGGPDSSLMEDMIHAEANVHGDREFALEVTDLPEGTRPVTLAVEDRRYSLFRSQDGKYIPLSMDTSDTGHIFLSSMGVVNLSVTVDDHGVVKTWYAEPVVILLPMNSGTEDLSAMLDDIYSFQEDFLYVRESVPLKSHRRDSLVAQIRLLLEITGIYEEEYGYFKTNSRTRLEQVMKVDETDRMEYVDARMLAFMVQHPEYLRPAVNGIPYEGAYYAPQKVLMAKNRITHDVYENQLIISFLAKLLRDARDLRQKISSLLASARVRSCAEEGYVASSNFFMGKVGTAMRIGLTSLDDCIDRLMKTYNAYRTALKVTEIDVTHKPRPTATLLNVPQYHRIYVSMDRWYELMGYSFAVENEMLHFYNIPHVYEIYCLVRLVRAIEAAGFHLENAMQRDYGLKESIYYHKGAYNNTFIFTKENGCVLTLFYQPVIYDGSFPPDRMISLYRNSSVSFTEAGRGGVATGRYYVPDYVLKMREGDREDYYILDAKYKTREAVRAMDVSRLSYKYLISLSPGKPSAHLKGLLVLYGKPSPDAAIENFRDRRPLAAPKDHQIICLIPVGTESDFQLKLDFISRL